MAFFRSGLLIPDLKENINTMRKEMESTKITNGTARAKNIISE